MKIDLSKVKVGDEVFSALHGAGTVLGKDKKFLEIQFKKITRSILYHMDGKLTIFHINPTLFNSAAECARYFQEVADNEKD